VQLASAEACLLAHVFHLPAFPARLGALVEDARVWKVGTGVGADLRRLQTDYSLRPASFVDLAVVAGLYRYARVGLQGLAAEFGASVEKSKAIQLSNWETVPLRPAQVAYAAQDAALGLWLLRRLHAAHAPALPLSEWSAAFLNASSLPELCADRAARHGPLGDVLAAYKHAVTAAAAARAALLADRRCASSLAAGLAEPMRAISSITEIAQARQQALTWQLTPPPAGHGGSGSFAGVCVLEGVPLGRGAGRTRAAAKRAAAVAALQLLATQAAQAAPLDASAPPADTATLALDAFAAPLAVA
jgi:hypothetical protein